MKIPNSERAENKYLLTSYRRYFDIHGTAISYRCAKFGAFVNSVTILTLRDLTIKQHL